MINIHTNLQTHIQKQYKFTNIYRNTQKFINISANAYKFTNIYQPIYKFINIYTNAHKYTYKNHKYVQKNIIIDK